MKKKIKNKEKTEFEEVEINCAGCGRKMRVIKRKGYSIKGMLCQRCGLGEQIENELD